MPSNPYATNKLAYHQDAVEKLRRGERPAPLQIHLMPQNLCNHDCHFCSYRMSSWKNGEWFDDTQQIPPGILVRLLGELADMGVKALEVTGGGEPTVYRHFDLLLDLIEEHGFDFALVSNGTAITPFRAKQMGRILTWARISIDAGDSVTYANVRRVSVEHWDKAWAGVRLLSEFMEHPERRLGVGFVLTNENVKEIISVCELAKANGADNVRLSVMFNPEGNDYYNPGVLDEAEELALQAEAALDDDRFLVVNLIPERRQNQLAERQDYNPCFTKDLLCVVGGDSKVYHCCTLAFSPEGYVGDLREQSFRAIWENFQEFDPRERCLCQCLYEKRNRNMIEIVTNGKAVVPNPNGIHRNFI